MIGLTVVPDFAMQQCRSQQLQDIVRHFDTDVLFTPSRVHEPFLQSHLEDSVTVATQPLQPERPLELASSDDVSLIWVSTPRAIEQLIETDTPADRVAETYLLSDQLSVSVDLINLDARLDGLSEYRAPLADHDALEAFTHLSIEANPEYRAEWQGVDVQGVMPGANEQQGVNQAGIAHFELQQGGVVGGKTRKLGDFGLAAVTQVGESRVQTLRDAEIQSRQDLSTASVREIANLSGIGQSLARTVIESAQVIEEGEVRKAPGASLPDSEPIFIDIETDGLNPTMIWLIGVLNRATEDRYMPFIETDPSKPGEALEAFMSWLAEFGHNRPVVAYNGWDFDFPVIEEHIAEHCPEYLDTWEGMWKFDPYYWAVKENNAILPGLTNKLEDVAPALGWETIDTGLTGAEVGRLFQRYADNPCPATELDWDRHKKYCEDDVRALAYVYDAIKETTNRMTQGSGNGTSSPSETSSQGTLSDF
ncbi:ribonuclease H-like domain-containing protein [Halorientalis brevis]|uniref:Ribonuclease H-like domain-containing protein n=1 Tax=Halorientalis brevis TaxID=1126241 RepID=A0ABD6CHE6_9EURY|nr:ribonuclease H-like domain-containing protein [Halorientalis brevis]